MSFSDMYRRAVESSAKELGKHHSDKASHASKRADIQRRISSANQSASRASSVSSKKSYLNTAIRLQGDLVSIEKKMADTEGKIANAQKKLGEAQTKLANEELKESKKRQSVLDQATKSSERAMRSVVSKLRAHDGIHIATQATIKKLTELPEKIKVLFLAANPMDEPELRLDEEVRAIAGTIRKAKHRDSVELLSVWAVRPADVLQALNEHNPQIVHFSGHGSDLDEIGFLDDVGNAKWVSKDAIVQLMMASAAGIRLVFFNTCYSSNQAQAVTQHVEAAIGMNTEIGDEAARVFAAQFYSAIGFGLSLQQAFSQARALVMMEGIDEENTPELFVRDGLAATEIFIVRPPSSEVD
jgi:CHAT domain